MKLSRILLSSLGLLSLFVFTIPSFAVSLPTKRPSDYGVSDQQVKLDTPSFTTISQDGVTIGLDSVFCSINDCADGGGNPAGQSLTYFFSINLASGAQINSLTFDPGFTQAAFAYTGIVFDTTFSCAAGHDCAPGSDPAATFAGVDVTSVDCSTGSCVVSFTGFNFGNLGGVNLIFAAQTDPTSALNLNGVAQTPTLFLNQGTTVPVAEPSSFLLVGMAGLVCLAGIAGRRKVFHS